METLNTTQDKRTLKESNNISIETFKDALNKIVVLRGRKKELDVFLSSLSFSIPLYYTIIRNYRGIKFIIDEDSINEDLSFMLSKFQEVLQ